MNLEKLKLHSKAQGLWKSGFFMSESEDLDARMQDYNLYIKNATLVSFEQ